MRKITSLFFAVFAISALTAQITITSAAMPSSGDTIRYSTTSAVGIGTSWKTTGGSQSWDFSQITPTGQGLYEYKSASKTPYFFYFVGQIGQKTADSLGGGPFVFKNIYSFYAKSSTVFKAEGIGYSYSGIPLASMYTDPDEIYQFPLNYNDSDVSSFRFVFSIPGQNLFTFVQAGKRTNVVDAWGSIKTPYGTYSDVIRVKTIVDEVDTLSSQFLKTPIPRKQIIYRWLATSEKIPVFEIVGNVTNGTWTPTTINYRDKYQGSASNPLGIVADFSVDKTKGTVGVDTFNFANNSSNTATAYSWKFNPSGNEQYISGTAANSANPSVKFKASGLYSVTLKASNPLANSSDDTTVADLIFVGWGVNTKSFKVMHGVYPNPVNDVLHVQGMNLKDLKVVNSVGQVIEVPVTDAGDLRVSDLPPGIYFAVNSEYKIQFVKR